MSASSASAPAPSSTFLEELLGPSFFQSDLARKWLALSPTWRMTLFTVGLGVLIFVPFLGAVGLWDCWETHYGEVAREMIQRRDYVYPYWENAWFFSKPAFTLWMMALGMQVVGANGVKGARSGLRGISRFSRGRRGG